jgi:transposase InsO family protein
MERELRMGYLERVYQRYWRASKESKGRILDELCHVCGYNRKYAIWKLRRLVVEGRPKGGFRERRRSRRYGGEVFLVLEGVWEASGYPWSVRLKEIVRVWLPWIRLRYRMSAEVEENVLSISPSTIDRYLRAKKKRLRRRLYGRTKPGTLLRHKIPIKTDSWDVGRPGFMEADLVSHCGGVAQGEFIYSLNLTDIFSGWVETEAVMGKGQRGIVQALGRISERLAFAVLGIDSDNGSEFINHHLLRYCQQRGIQFTRSRPYKKDDNAHVEQKNWTHVRKFLGWDRYDSPEALQAINELYENELSVLMNLFQPSVKLLRMVRTGSRKRRIYDDPQTPSDRALGSGDLDDKKAQELKALRQRTDPFDLSERVNNKLERIWELAHYRYEPPEHNKKTKQQPGQLSLEEREALEAISDAFGIAVYARTRPGGELVAIGHG